MTIQSVFTYQSAKRYVVDFVNHQQKHEAAFSLRKWTKSMGMHSHAQLVMILQGKRPLTLRQVPFLAQGMKLSSPERLYFQALVQYENAKTPEERALCELWLAESNPGDSRRFREIDEYTVIAHWIHMAILAMTDNREFGGTAEEILRKLGGASISRVSLSEIRSAVERMKALGLVRAQDGKLVCTSARVTTKDDVANRGAREYHKQVAALGIEAIEKQSVQEREFQSFAVSVPKTKVALAKEMIRKFRTQFYEAMTSEPGDEVYQTQIQFFRLTECSSKMVSKVDEGAGFTNPVIGIQ